MKSSQLPHAVYANPLTRAQARLQGYMNDQVMQMERLQLGLSKIDRALVTHICEQRKILKKLPPIQIQNIANGQVISNLDIGYTTLPHIELIKIATHIETYIRVMLALNLGPKTQHQKVAEVLAHDDAHLVRRSLALNLFIQAPILYLLAQDKDVWVRRRVAYHSQIPKLLAQRLHSTDLDEDVRIIAGMQLT